MYIYLITAQTYTGPGMQQIGADMSVPGPGVYTKHEQVGKQKPAFSFGPGDTGIYIYIYIYAFEDA